MSNTKKITVVGNPTEGALLLWLNKQNVNYLDYREDVKMYQQVPFSTKYKFMATVVESPTFKKPMFYVKGAPEIVLQHCNKWQQNMVLWILLPIGLQSKRNCWHIKVRL